MNNRSTALKQESKETKAIIPFPTYHHYRSDGTSLPNNCIAVTDQKGILYIYDCLQAKIKMTATHPKAKNSKFQNSYLFGLPDGRVFYSFTYERSSVPSNYIFDPATQKWLDVNSIIWRSSKRRFSLYSLNSQDIVSIRGLLDGESFDVFRVSNGDFKSVFKMTSRYWDKFDSFFSLDDSSFLVTILSSPPYSNNPDNSINLVKYKKSSSGDYKEENRHKIDEKYEGIGLNASEFLLLNYKIHSSEITRCEYKSNKIEKGKTLPIQLCPRLIKHPENKEGLILGLEPANSWQLGAQLFLLNANTGEIQYHKDSALIAKVLPIGKSTFAALVSDDSTVYLYNPYALAITAEPIKKAIITAGVVCKNTASLIAEYATDHLIADKKMSQENRYKLFNTVPKSISTETEEEQENAVRPTTHHLTVVP